MEITIERPPRTMMEVYEMLPEGTLAELIDNHLYMPPSPSFFHQDICGEIYWKMKQSIGENGKVAIAPFDIKLDSTRNVVQPDITVILSKNPNQINELGKFIGVPDLIVEILSPGNKDYDLITKKDLYEEFGVKEYWVVDPDTKLSIGFSLRNNSYKKISEEIGKISSPLLNSVFSF
jgi:Uma2 family endonuclease